MISTTRERRRAPNEVRLGRDGRFRAPADHVGGMSAYSILVVVSVVAVVVVGFFALYSVTLD
jgi:hypothetical protein